MPSEAADEPAVPDDIGTVDDVPPVTNRKEPFESAEVAANFLATSRRELLAMARRGDPGPDDFVSLHCVASEKYPFSESVFVADHLRPAAIAAGVEIPDGHRFGLHNLRHSLSNWLVNAAKEDPKTVQGILRPERIETTLGLYTQSDMDRMRVAQGNYLNAMGSVLEVIA